MTFVCRRSVYGIIDFSNKMGILNLAKLLADAAPCSIQEFDIKTLFGRKIAIDASMCLYQFLIAIRQDGQNLENSKGEVTSHLNGLFYRTLRMLDHRIKPIYVFDGKPPVLKSDELAKRAQRRDDAEISRKEAEEEGDVEAVDKFSRRLVKVTADHVNDCKKLLTLMGIPYIEAPCEAEAQCADMVKKGLVFAVGTEDMDALTFGANILLRHLTFSEAKKMPVKQYTMAAILHELEINQAEFIDMCILLGCDYCSSIKGIGPKTAHKLIKEHKSIENVLNLNKYSKPTQHWLYKEARNFFLNPEVSEVKESDLVWRAPNEDGLIAFMVEENGFNIDRIKNGIAKITKSRLSQTQTRLDGFFTILPKESVKRKKEEINDKTKKKLKKTKKE
ncbi:hypothetical protein GJ496_006553 [Pomphorhynchus laevis]|nr:hypothetical protein GJ496_006553 [Pomphorhynchus laevis]